MNRPRMSSPRAVREALAALQIRPRKRWGQHFLVDANAVERLLATADLGADDTVLEIGPGLGVLTERLAEVAGRVVAVELDPTLAAWLTDRFADHAHVEIVEADALELDWAELRTSAEPAMALGNLPYHITAPLLDRLIRHRHGVERAVWMVQREVAEKLLATPGTRETSSLGVWVQAFCEVTRAFRVSKSAFYPPPEVESVVLAIRPREAPAFTASEASFRRAIRAAYGARRKTLRRALSIGLGVSTDQAGQILRRAEIDGRRRGETLDLDEFDRLARAIEAELDADALTARTDTPPIG